MCSNIIYYKGKMFYEKITVNLSAINSCLSSKCATFIQKEDKSSLVSDNQTKTPISESQALDIARTAIIDDIGSGNFESLTLQTGDSEYSAVASTFKGVTFWLIQVNATYLQKGDTMNKFYQIKINYYTGETLEVAKSF